MSQNSAVEDPRASPDAWLLASRRRHTTGGYDEVADGRGAIRASWQKLAGLLHRLGESELRKRWEHARALLHEHGVSYDFYEDPRSATRPWNLSPVPVALSGEEWGTISRGVRQRARLLEKVLADIYGPRKLIASGDLPPDLVFANPAFLRACAGFAPPNRRYLPLYAVDLARDEAGRIVVLADRTQSPSGAGYALENRIVLSRVLPEVFRECNVERLAAFFRSMRQTLFSLAPHDRDNPRIVLLTPGPYHPTYFEQAFLAQYLGLTLAQGGDLTVRDQRVFLRTLGELQTVDVIVRRVADRDCDPLELRPDTLLGVPGLVEAARSGNVAIVNPLGSGFLQTSALMAFLPNLCRRVLGEDLELSSIPTYWCGDPSSLSHVLAHLPDLVIRSAVPDGGQPVLGRDLPLSELEELRGRVSATPRLYVAQEPTVLSTVPILLKDRVSAAHLWMRAYVTASGDDFEVMPGALSRVGSAGENLGLLIRPGGFSQDTWIQSDGPVSNFSLLAPPSAPALLSRGGGDLPSRIADNLFWLGRYTERADGTARIGRSIGMRMSDEGGSIHAALPPELDALFTVLSAETQVLHPLLATLEAPTPSRAGAASRERPSWIVQAERSLLAAVFEGEPLETLKTTIRAAYGAARSVRDRISADTWRTLAHIERELRQPRGITGSSRMSALMNLLNEVVTALAAFSGLATDSMTRGQAWRFLDMGRRLERGVHMLSVLRGAFGKPCGREAQLLEAMLEVADSTMTYRRRYLATLQVAPVVDLLLLDETNPRSVIFQLTTLGAHIDALPRTQGVPKSQDQKLILGALAELGLCEITDLCEPDAQGRRTPLLRAIDRAEANLRQLSTYLSGAYLNHAMVSRQLQTTSQ